MARSFKIDWRTRKQLTGPRVKLSRRGCIDKWCEWCLRDKMIQQMRETQRAKVPDSLEECE